MANNTYISEAFEKLNKMSRMHDSKKSLRESSRRGRDDYKSYILNSLKDSGYSNFARMYSDYDFHESNGRNVVIDDTAKEIKIPNNMSVERIVRELTSKSRANSYKESSRRGLKESEDEEVEISTCAIRLDSRDISYKVVLSDLDERIRDNELSVIEEKNNDPFVEYVIQGNEDSIYSFLHENRRRIMDYEYLPYNESYKKGLTEAEMSPEDEADTEVLRNIQDKMKRRPSSARLNRKELAVLDKYGLSYDKDRHNLVYNDGFPFFGLYNDNTNANIADSARKQYDRRLARRGTDGAVRDARDRHWDMETALYRRNWARQELDRLDDKNKPSYAPGVSTRYQGPQTADSLAKDIYSIKSGRTYDRMSAQDTLDKSQHEINKLLRRDESLTEASHPYKGFTVEDEDSHYVIRDFTGNIQSTADTPEEAHQIIDSELGTKRLTVNVNKFPDLESYCKKFNLSIVDQERSPYIEYTIQGDLNYIYTLIDYINHYKALANNA